LAQIARGSKKLSSVVDTHKQDVDALIASKLPSVEIIINQTAASFPAHVDRDELYSAGCLGLVEAANRFDASKGFSFSTWAEYRIRGAVLDYARSQDRLSQNNRRNARELTLTLNELTQFFGRPPTNAEMASKLQWSTNKVQEVKSFMEGSKVSSRSIEEHAELGHGGTIDQTATTPEEQAENHELLQILRVSLSALDDQQREIVTGLYVEGLTTKDVAERCGVSISRVAQLRNETLEVLRDALSSHLEEPEQDVTPKKVSKRHARSRDAILNELKAVKANRPERPQPPRPHTQISRVGRSLPQNM
jgi:RNA polymerase sigma factor FliA